MTGRDQRTVASALLRALYATRDGDDLGAIGVIDSALGECDGADPMRLQLEHLLALARAGLSADIDACVAPEFAPPASATLAALTAWAEGLWADDARIESLRAVGDVRSAASLAIALTAWSRRAAPAV